MCGIVGEVSVGGVVERDWVVGMCAVVRHRGPDSRGFGVGARPGGEEAVVLRAARWWVVVWVGGEVDLAGWGGCSPAGFAGERRVFAFSVCAGSVVGVRGLAQAAAGAHVAVARWAQRAEPVLEAVLSAGAGGRRGRGARVASRAAAGSDEDTDAQRRAAGGVLVGGCRLERGGGGDGTLGERPGEDVFDRLRRQRL